MSVYQNNDAESTYNKSRAYYQEMEKDYSHLRQLMHSFLPMIENMQRKMLPFKLEIKTAGDSLISLNRAISGLAENFGKILGQSFIGKDINSASGLMHNVGNMLGKVIGSMIFGSRAQGGNIAAGNNYLVGEKGPEFFTPHRSGYITPNHGLNSNRQVNIVMNINTPDSSSFRKSQGQIVADMARVLSRAYRNL